MKTIPYVAPVALTNHLGEPWPSKEAQKTITQKEFLLDQAGSPGFAGHRRGLEQIEFSLAVREAINAVQDGADLELEDAHADALAKAVRMCEFSQSLAHNFPTFARAVLKSSPD